MDSQTITTYYEHDHDRLDGIFKEFQATRQSEFERAVALFREFKAGLMRHILWEEEILFPIFENKTNMHGYGPTAVMRSEHRLIEQYLEAIHAKLAQRNADTEPEEQALLKTLFEHNMKEERILYPEIDKMMVDEERMEVFERMKTKYGA